MNFKRNIKRRMALVAGVALIVLSLGACGVTSGNSYGGTPVDGEGHTYTPVKVDENDRNTNDPINNIECFKMERDWNGPVSDHSVELGTYCRVSDTTTTEAPK